MKRHVLISIVSLSVTLMVLTPTYGQRGRGGARGGSRPSPSRSPSAGRSPSFNRSPSMSRPSPSRPTTRPSLPSTRPTSPQRPTTRPSTPQRPTTRPGAGQRPSSNDLKNFLQAPNRGPRPSTPQRPTTRPNIDRGTLQGSIGVTPGQRPSMPDWFTPGTSPPTTRPAPGIPERPTQLPAPGNRPQKPPAVKPPGQRPPGTRPPETRPPGQRPPGTRPPGTRPPVVRPPQRPPALRPPGPGRPHYPARPWHPWHPGHGGYRPGHWWHWATAGAVTGWIAHRWTTPIYYRYGAGGNVYYQDNSVYIDGEPYCSSEQYYQQAVNIAAAEPEMSDEAAANVDWLPLGVFALTQEGVNTTSMYLQLAVSKEGIISGTFYNETSGATHPVEGMVDEATQRAVWRAADATNPDIVMETGLYNLTEDQANLLVHFGPEQTQQWLMVRLEQSEQPATPETKEGSY